MSHEYSNSESIQQIMTQLSADPPALLLPEFQRDFAWDLESSYTLFDSIVQGLYIGSLKYGKPDFEMALRRVDVRPRRGEGSRAKVERLLYDEKRMKAASQISGLRIILDGQQRLTSIYRALKGHDKVYFTVRSDVTAEGMRQLSLEQLLHPELGIQGEDLRNQVCVPLDYAYLYTQGVPFDDEVQEYFRNQTAYGRALVKEGDMDAERAAFKIFRQVLPKLKTLYEEPRLMSYYLLDMGLDKFVIFFERYNKLGLKLNFTDVLAAKLYGHFNLRQAFEDLLDRHPGIPIKRELLVRAVAVFTERLPRVERTHILRELTANDFKKHWPDVARLYIRTLDYLHEQRYMVSPRWLPSETMMLPLMMFFFELDKRRNNSMTQQQQMFIRWWYWSTTFAEHYSAASNEKILTDTRLMQRVARGEQIDHSYFLRMRPNLSDPEQLFTYGSASSVIYKGVLNLVHFAAEGLRDWTSDNLLSVSALGSLELQDHHVFPQAFLRRTMAKQDRPEEVEAVRDSVVNRVLMPKGTNLRASDKAPYRYLNDLLQVNPQLRHSMSSHLVAPELLDNEQMSSQVYLTLYRRAEQILKLIRRETLEAEPAVRSLYAPERPAAGD